MINTPQKSTLRLQIIIPFGNKTRGHAPSPQDTFSQTLTYAAITVSNPCWPLPQVQ